MRIGKYNAKKTVVDGIKFDSKGESQRYLFLKYAQNQGILSGLERQITFRLEVNGILIAKYICDFKYDHAGKTVYEDFKGIVTPVCKIKLKLMKAIYNIDVKLVKKPTEGIQ